MTDLETQLHDTLHAALDGPHSLSGPALRRRARTRQLTVRSGSVVALGAAGTAAALVVPGLLASPAGRPTAAPVGAASTKPAVTAAPTATAAAAPASAIAPTSTDAAAAAASTTASTVPVEANVWAPAGNLVDDPTVLAVAPQVASKDAEWTAWSDGQPLLDKETVSVAFADNRVIDPAEQYPHPLVIVTGRTSADSPTLRIAALTTIEAGAARTDLHDLTVDAMTTVQPGGSKAIAVTDGLHLYVVAAGGVDQATFSYHDSTGDHTAAMTVTNGVATATSPMADLKASPDGQITNIRALSHGTVVWDAAPVKGR